METKEMGVVEMRLPFKRFFGYKNKLVGFRFNILSWSILCELFNPVIEFHQIEELEKTNPKQLFEKMVLAGVLSYHFKFKNNPVVTELDINYWLYKMSAEKRDFVVLNLQTTILNSKIMGKMMSQIITEKEEEKKN